LAGGILAAAVCGLNGRGLVLANGVF